MRRILALGSLQGEYSALVLSHALRKSLRVQGSLQAAAAAASHVQVTDLALVAPQTLPVTE